MASMNHHDHTMSIHDRHVWSWLSTRGSFLDTEHSPNKKQPRYRQLVTVFEQQLGEIAEKPYELIATHAFAFSEFLSLSPCLVILVSKTERNASKWKTPRIKVRL